MNQENFSTELLNSDAKNNLTASGSWAKILGYCGLVYSGFMVLISVFMIVGVDWFQKLAAADSSEMYGSGIMRFVSIFYLMIAAVFAYVSWQILQYGLKVKIGLRQNDSSILNESFNSLRIFFTAYGILTLISIGFIILIIIVFISMGYFASSTTSGTFG